MASYSNEFAAELHRQFRMVIDAPWYRALFPDMQLARDTGTELVTTAGGSRFATSVGGALTGRSADLIIVDDPLKAEEAFSEVARKRVIDWYGGTLVSRLNDKNNGPIVVVMQRLHENDLAGHVLEKGGWEHLDLPAIAVEDGFIPLGNEKQMTRRVGDVLHPQRESKETLDRTKIETGSLKFSAQFQQRPVPLEGNLVRRDWFRYYDHLPDVSAKRIVQSWDIAQMTGDANDYSVCTTWWIIKSDYYLVDVFRDRLPYPDLRREIASLAAKHNAATVLIENAGLACPCCRISGAIRRRECRAPSLASRRAASSIAWCRSPPKSRPDTLFCQSRPTGSIFSCMNSWRSRMVDTMIKWTVCHNS